MDKKLSYVTTYSGVKVFPFNASTDSITIEDIAHHLSQLNRWLGGTVYPYSVAQHPINVALTIKRWYELDPIDSIQLKTVVLQALMHDATEAYCNDVATPIKNNLPDYKELENNLWEVISEKFYLPSKWFPKVAEADSYLAQLEAVNLLQKIPDWVQLNASELLYGQGNLDFSYWGHDRAKQEFLAMFEQYKLLNAEVN